VVLRVSPVLPASLQEGQRAPAPDGLLGAPLILIDQDERIPRSYDRSNLLPDAGEPGHLRPLLFGVVETRTHLAQARVIVCLQESFLRDIVRAVPAPFQIPINRLPGTFPLRSAVKSRNPRLGLFSYPFPFCPVANQVTDVPNVLFLVGSILNNTCQRDIV